VQYVLPTEILTEDSTIKALSTIKDTSYVTLPGRTATLPEPHETAFILIKPEPLTRCCHGSERNVQHIYSTVCGQWTVKIEQDLKIF
jgi:hypothetical protein